MPAYRWATLGCGVIGNELAQAMQNLGGSLYSVGNRTHEKALTFAEKYGIAKVYDKPEDIFADPDVDIVYISTPHNTHIRYLLPALTSGKHVLCEKSITLNSRELDQARRCATEHGVILAEAMTLYHMPIYKQIADLIGSGALGPLRFIQMNFGSYKDYDMKNRFFNRSLAGGALLDIGVYALHAKQPKRGMAAFDKGYIEIYDYPRADTATITYTADGRQQVLQAGSQAKALQYEIVDMENAVAHGGQGMYLDYTKEVMDLMTTIRQQWGLTYPEEEGGVR